LSIYLTIFMLQIPNPTIHNPTLLHHGNHHFIPRQRSIFSMVLMVLMVKIP
jgi:hypothetical protein